MRKTRRLKGGLGTPTGVNQTPLTPVPTAPAPSAPTITVNPMYTPTQPKFIRKGAYGCLYRPPIQCDMGSGVNPVDGEVTKLIRTDNAAEELALADILRPIDPDQKYFVYAGKSCTRTLRTMYRPLQAEINKCTPVKGQRTATLLIMPDAGTDLDTYSPKKYGPTFLAARNLLEGLSKLHSIGYAHFDIKPGNIVAGDTMRFIDFGLMRKLVGYPQEDWRYEYGYPWYSFEVKYLSTAYNLMEIDTYWKDYHGATLAYQPESRDNSMWGDRLTRVIPSTETRTDSEAIHTEFMRDPVTTGSKILVHNDIVALGRSLGQLYYRLTSHSPGNGVKDIFFRGKRGGVVVLKASPSPGDLGVIELTAAQHAEQLKLSEFSKLWFTMCETMMHPMPSKRMSLADALSYFDSTIAPAVSTYFP